MGAPSESPASLQLTSNVIFNSTEQRALDLLAGGNLTQEQVAGALGVTPSFISQLISREDFSAELVNRKVESLQKHNERDSKLDALEDTLIEKFENTLPLMHRPLEILKSLQIINAAKRRGASAPEATLPKQTVINLVMPTQIIHKFSQTNIHNQVTKAGSQELLTIQSSNLLELSREVKGVQNEQQRIAGAVAGESNSS